MLFLYHLIMSSRFEYYVSYLRYRMVCRDVDFVRAVAVAVAYLLEVMTVAVAVAVMQAMPVSVVVARNQWHW